MFWQSISTWLELAFWFGLMAWGVFTILRGTIGGAIGIIRSIPVTVLVLLVLACLCFSWLS